MKKIGLYISAFALALGVLSSCERDLDEYHVSAPAASTLEQSAATVVVDDKNLGEIVYTLKFSASDSPLSSDIATSLGAGAYLLECSLDPTFPASATKSELLSVKGGNNEKAYTGADLNLLALSMGAKAGEPTKLFFRINHTYNEKSGAMGSMSNVAELTFTPVEVAAALNVVSVDGSEIVAQLVFNKQTNLYEGEYTYKDWNFYFVDAVEGTVYGCDDEWSKPDDQCNRSYKIVKGRTIGDSYSMWFDPSIRPVTMKVNLETMTWSFERIATDKKDLTGVSILLVGADMGWNDGWVPNEDLPGVVVSGDGDVYTAVFENVEITANNAFGFRATEPAGAWIGYDNFSSIGDALTQESGGNLTVKESGIYKVTVTMVAEGDGTVSYKLDAEKSGSMGKKDLTGVSIILVGADMGWHDQWTPDEGTIVKANGDEYTAVFENVSISANNGFGFRATAPAASWIGYGNFEGFISDALTKEEAGGNLTVKQTGVYTVTVTMVANDDGSVTYKIDAVLSGAMDKKDLTGVSIIIVGADMGWHDQWTPDEGVMVTANGDEYTAVFENIALTDQFGFRATEPATSWIGPDTFESLGDNLVKDGNIKATAPGYYNITVTAIAKDDGSIVYRISAVKTGDLSARDLSDKEQGIKGSFNDWTVVKLTKPEVDGNVYTYFFSGIEMEENAEFGFDGDLSWVGKGGVTVNSSLISSDLGNLSVTQKGVYTFVLIATANSDGSVSYELTAERPSK